MEKKNRTYAYALPLLAALLWGMSFVVQKDSARFVDPFTYNCARNLLASLTVGLFLLFSRRRGGLNRTPHPTKKWIPGGLLCGFFLFAAHALQQTGIAGTEAGKAGFITSLYLIFVPLAGLFLRRKLEKKLWVCVAAALCGLGLLCLNEHLSLSRGDALMLLSAVAYTFYILGIDHFVQFMDPAVLSCCQLLAASLFSGIAAILTGENSGLPLRDCWIQLLYVGILSGAVANVLQSRAQKLLEPATVSLLLSFESVFGVLSGAVFLRERLTLRELGGCTLMFFAVLLLRLPISRQEKDQ